MTTIQQQILQTLAYFDIFHYPLTNEEVKTFLCVEANQSTVDEQLAVLISNEKLYKIGSFYSLQNNLSLAERRSNGNKKATEEIEKAAMAARVLFRFPFVEGLALSGSLSKNFADETTDIDFFIIAKTNRLWIARTLMHIFYKFAKLAGKQRLYCMNYYIDEAGMEIEEKNIFTAMEIITLVPMQGVDCINSFSNSNKWIHNYFPAHKIKISPSKQIKKNRLRIFTEKILSGKPGNAIDNCLMKITAKRWLKKEDRYNLNAKGVCMGMLAGKHYAKPDPKNFQFKILQQYENKIKQSVLLDNKLQILAT